MPFIPMCSSWNFPDEIAHTRIVHLSPFLQVSTEASWCRTLFLYISIELFLSKVTYNLRWASANISVNRYYTNFPLYAAFNWYFEILAVVELDITAITGACHSIHLSASSVCTLCGPSKKKKCLFFWTKLVSCDILPSVVRSPRRENYGCVI